MGFLMRALLIISLLLLAGCGAQTWLENRPIEGRGAEWAQEGGDAQRSHTSTVIANSRDRIEGTVETGFEENEWTFSLEAAGSRAGPLLYNGMVFFSSATATVEAIDLATTRKTGEFSCRWVIQGTPVILKHHLFVATIGTESPMHCFSMTDGHLVWTRMIEPVHAPLCAHDGSVYAAGMHGAVYRFEAEDSVEVWKVNVDATMRAAPAAIDSVLVVVTSAGDMFGLSTHDGRKLWRIPTLAAILAGPVIANGLVIGVNCVGTVTCADAYTGIVQWTTEVGAPVYYSPAVRDGRVYVPLSSGELVLLDLQDGSLFKKIRIGELPGASPVLHGPVLYQLTRKGVLYAVSLQTYAITEVYTLPGRSETPPLLTPSGIVLVDEEGEAVLAVWRDETNSK
jgi:outer membrane protein assembly factor BamB